jgi:hypothetical protein
VLFNQPLQFCFSRAVPDFPFLQLSLKRSSGIPSQQRVHSHKMPESSTTHL